MAVTTTPVALIARTLQNVRIGGSTSVLPVTELAQLGRINIICGRNASGKSTLLQAIHTGNRVLGVEMTGEKLEHLYRLCASGTDFGRRSDREERFRELVRRAADQHPRAVWYSDQGPAFRKTFEAEYKESDLAGVLRMRSDPIENEFQSLFPEIHPRSVLIPAKRELERTADLRVSGGGEPRGAGVLAKILFAQTQLPGLAERNFFERLGAAFRQISDGFLFAVETREQNQIALHFSGDQGATWVTADACGQGLHELLLVLFFALRPEYELLCIEEPENHMHPDMQRRLLAFFREGTTKQFFIATHSNVFLNAALTDKVYFTTFAGTIRIDDATSRAMVLNDLGYSVTDNLISDLVILVEGPKDQPVIQEFLRKWGLLGQYDIKIWPLGGDIMDQIDLSVFAGRYRLLAVLDQDPGSAAVRRRFEENCAQFSIPIHRLQRYAIENYFSLEALRTVFGGQIADDIKALDRARKLEDQIGLNPKKSNRRLAELTSREELDLSDIPQLMAEIERLCKETVAGDTPGH